MAPDKWERAKERFTDWFDYSYARAVKRSPDARSLYKERIKNRERYWEEQHALKARRQLEDKQRRELEIQDFLDEKLPLVPSPTEQGFPARAVKAGSAVSVYVPTGTPTPLAAGRGGALPHPRHPGRPGDSTRIPMPRGYFARPPPKRRRRYTCGLDPLAELEEEGGRGNEDISEGRDVNPALNSKEPAHELECRETPNTHKGQSP